MKKNTLFTLAVFFFCRVLFSQTIYQHGFLPYGTDTEEKNSQPNYQLYKQQLHKKYDTIFSKVEDCNNFIKLLINDLRENFESGGVYTNWPTAQNYVNRVFNKIIPGANPDSVNVKIIRSPDINAFMTGTGQAYITVGYLANALNEAEIATTFGHEYGHYIHHDAYNSFMEYTRNETHKKVGNMFAGYGGGIFGLVSTSNMYKAYQNMERDADKTSVELTKLSNYNLLARVSALKRYKIIEENIKRDKDYRSTGIFYFSTHPPTQERIDVAQKDANANDTVKTKYYQIDEALFKQIKMQAVDECIRILLQQQNFEDCVELCYKQLLFNPTDEFYLFYVNEALRRYLTVKPLEADDFFITGRYTTYSKYLPKNKMPVYVNSQTLKPVDARVTQTIPYHYEYLMLADKDKLFVTLPDNNLTRTDTLEFVTNKDALAYFMDRQEKLNQSSVKWVKNCQANTIGNVQINSTESFLNAYNDVKNAILALNTTAEEKTMPCILGGISYLGRSSFIPRSDFTSDNLYAQCANYMKNDLQAPYTYFDYKILTRAERNAFFNFIAGMEKTVKDNSKKVEIIETAYLPLTLLSPEIVSILNKYKLQKFMVVNMHITDAMSLGYVNFTVSFTLTTDIYCIDLKNGFLSHNTEKHNIGSNNALEMEFRNLNANMPPLQYFKK